MSAREFIARDEWHRHGRIVLPSLSGVALLGVHAYTLGAMIPSLEQQFGWSRAQISAGLIVPSATGLLLGPVIGSAIDRFGSRTIALVGIPVFCCALALLSVAGPGILSWWLLYGLVGLASLLIFPTVWAAAITRRFDRNRGMALAIVLAGTGLSGAIMPAVTTALIRELGWRQAYVAVAVVCFLIVYPLVLLFFERGGPRLSSDATAPQPRAPKVRPPYRSLVSARFLKLAGAVIIFTFCACVLTTNSVPILLGEGFDPMAAAGIAGLVGIGTIIGRLSGGLLLDRVDGRFVALGTCAMPILGAGALIATNHSEGAAMFACLAMGVAGGAEYDASAYLAGRHFEVSAFGFLFGVISAVTMLSAAIAPVAANAIYDATRSYELVLIAIIPGFMVSALLFLLLGSYPRLGGAEAPHGAA
jgi:predicted MFS family arabinose efflux permease